jgi:Bacterial RNA polymerase, alpha chain C terminal domain
MANKNNLLIQDFEKFVSIFCNKELLQIMGLSERRIQIVTLRVINQMSLLEIGKTFQLPPSLVKQMYDSTIRRMNVAVNTYIQELPKVEKLQDVINGLEVELEVYRKKYVQQQEMALDVEENPSLLISLEDMGLSARTYNALKRRKFATVYDISKCTIKDLLKTRNFGNCSMRELEEKLEEYGVILSNW